MAYDRINWQNEPSEATALNDVNLNKMDSAIYDHDQRLDTAESDIEDIEGDVATIQGDITDLENDKVDKVSGKGLSQVDSVSVIASTYAGTKIGEINVTSVNGTAQGNFLFNGVVVDNAMSSSSENPVQNKDVKSALVDKVDKESGKGLSTISAIGVTASATDGDTIADIIAIDQSGTTYHNYIKNGVVVDSAISSSSENPVQNKVVKEELDKKLDGTSSEELNVRSAMMLLTPPISNNAPYVKRVVGGGIANPYLCKLNKLIGATVVWNQLVDIARNSTTVYNLTITRDTTDTRKLTISGTPSSSGNIGVLSTTFVGEMNHIYYAFFDVPSTSAYKLNCMGKTANVGDYGVIEKKTTTANIGINIAVTNGVEVNATFHSHLVDLTAMFGSTIADYVYTLETAEQGSGIAWLKSYGFFTEEYYAYSANTIQSVSVSGKKNVGKNQVNGDTVFSDYKITSNSYKATNSQFVNAKFYLGDFIGQTVTFSIYISALGGINRAFVQGYINGSSINGGAVTTKGYTSVTVTPQKSTDFVHITYGSVTGTVNLEWNNVQLEIGSARTAYEPYIVTTYPLDHTTLRGLFKLDANNNLYADGDEYLPSGGENVRYEERAYQSGDESLANAITDGTNTVVKLQTPTTATLTPYTSLQNIESGGTEEFIDYGVEQGTRDMAIPCGQESEYNSGMEIPNLPTSGEKVALNYDPSNGKFSWE